MNPERTVAFEIVALLFAIVAGLIVRGRWRRSVFFLVYIVNGLAFSILVAIWPERFYTRASFLVAELVTDILKLGLVLEIAYRTFHAFPGAESSARKVLIAVLTATAVTVTVTPIAVPSWDSYLTAIAYIDPLVNAGAIWLTVTLLAAARWYRVPVHPFHVALLTSFVSYLVILSTTTYVAALHGFAEFHAYLSVIDKAVFTVVACWWVYVAWRPETSLVRAYTEILQKLRLEASSSPLPSRGFSGR